MLNLRSIRPILLKARLTAAAISYIVRANTISPTAPNLQTPL